MLENILLDQQVFLLINQMRTPILNMIFPYISLLGSIYGTVLITFLLWLKNPKIGALIVISLVLNTAIVYGMKEIIQRPRPTDQFQNVTSLDLENDRFFAEKYSFPSGHTNRIFTVMELAGKIYPPSAGWLLLGAVVGFSTIYDGTHFPLDVLVGAAIGIVVSYLVFRWQSKFGILVRLSERVHSMIFGRFKKNQPLS